MKGGHFWKFLVRHFLFHASVCNLGVIIYNPFLSRYIEAIWETYPSGEYRWECLSFSVSKSFIMQRSVSFPIILGSDGVCTSLRVLGKEKFLFLIIHAILFHMRCSPLFQTSFVKMKSLSSWKVLVSNDKNIAIPCFIHMIGWSSTAVNLTSILNPIVSIFILALQKWTKDLAHNSNARKFIQANGILKWPIRRRVWVL